MFIIRTKRAYANQPDRVMMKTPLGLLEVAFAAETDARAYLEAKGFTAHFESPSRESLLQRDPAALDGMTHVLLIPSADVMRALLRNPSEFPYERYVVPMPQQAQAGGPRPAPSGGPRSIA